jgi:hypothetical protein
MMRYSAAEKETHVKNIRSWMENWRATSSSPATTSSLEGSCLYWAGVALSYFDSIGETALLQAGSASWARISREKDDGVVNTHFSYMFEISKTTLKKILAGEMPEMHVWVAITNPQQIIDLTTLYVPTQCKKLTGMDWFCQTPPEFVWTEKDEIDGYYLNYVPDMTAIQLAVSMLKQSAPELPYATGDRK